MENFLLIVGLGVLAVYFFSSMSVYKTLYQRVNEEKNMLQTDNDKYKELVTRYEKQIKAHNESLKNSQYSLSVARGDLQETRIENSELKHKVEVLEARSEELYAQVNTMV